MRLFWIAILIVLIAVSIGIFLHITTLTEALAKKTVIYDVYQNRVIYSEKDADGNDINQVTLIRQIHTFIDSYGYLRERVPIEYHYSNGTIIFSDELLHRLMVQCPPGTFLLVDTCIPGYSFNKLEIGETKRFEIFLDRDKKAQCHGMGAWIDNYTTRFPSCAEVPPYATDYLFCVNEERLPFCYSPI